MKRIPDERFDIHDYRSRYSKDWITTEEGLLADCGTAACLAGWIAVSAEFRADGGYSGGFGAPMISLLGKSLRGVDAVQYWLDIEPEEADALCMPYSYCDHHGLEENEVRPRHVIEYLEELLDD